MGETLLEQAESLVRDHMEGSLCTIHSGVATNFSWGLPWFVELVRAGNLMACLESEFNGPTIQRIASGELPEGAKIGVTKITLRRETAMIDVAWFLDDHTALTLRVQKKVRALYG